MRKILLLSMILLFNNCFTQNVTEKKSYEGETQTTEKSEPTSTASEAEVAAIIAEEEKKDNEAKTPSVQEGAAVAVTATTQPKEGEQEKTAATAGKEQGSAEKEEEKVSTKEKQATEKTAATKEPAKAKESEDEAKKKQAEAKEPEGEAKKKEAEKKEPASPAVKKIDEVVQQSPIVASEKIPVEVITKEDEAPEKPVEAESIVFALPEPTIDVAVEIPETFEEEEPVGIDTVSLEDGQGNWLFKRIWWERAEDRYGKIRSLVNSVWESRINFFVKRNELDRNVLDPFYLSIGITQGELQVILSDLNEFFEEKRERQGDLSEKDRALYETLATEQESLKQLQNDVESIAKIDHAIDDALGVLMDQINRVRQFEKQAWENFKEIAHVLSDTKARELYYVMDGAGRNIKNISTYLEQPFMQHFTRLIEEAKKHVARVQKEIQSLKEKGVDFRRQIDKAQEEQEGQNIDENELEETEAKPKAKQSWFGWLISWPKKALDFVVFVISYPFKLIFGRK